MSSYTVSISNDSTSLRCQLFPPLHLNQDKLWEAALLDFATYNSIPNISEEVNSKLHYMKSFNESYHEVVELKTGAYEITDINRELQRLLGKSVIELKANNNNLRSEIKCKYFLDFSQPGSIGELLGFPRTSSLLEPNIVHESPSTVNINKINAINITCNIVQGSYKDGSNGHILHTFYPSVPPGFRIVEKPHNLIYLPLNTTHISDIVVNVLDQDGNVVDFRGEIVTLRLHIRKVL